MSYTTTHSGHSVEPSYMSHMAALKCPPSHNLSGNSFSNIHIQIPNSSSNLPQSPDYNSGKNNEPTGLTLEDLHAVLQDQWSSPPSPIPALYEPDMPTVQASSNIVQPPTKQDFARLLAGFANFASSTANPSGVNTPFSNNDYNSRSMTNGVPPRTSNIEQTISNNNHNNANYANGIAEVANILATAAVAETERLTDNDAARRNNRARRPWKPHDPVAYRIKRNKYQREWLNHMKNDPAVVNDAGETRYERHQRLRREAMQRGDRKRVAAKWNHHFTQHF
eukprot:5432794-Prymnesium_polylepis.1